MLCRAIQVWWVMVESSDKMWSTGERNDKPLQYSCLENPMNSMKRQKGMTLKDELPKSVGVQYATGEEWRNNSKKNEEMEPKQKQYPVVDVTGDGSRVRCCKVNPLANINWAPDNAKHYLVCFTFTFLFNLYTTVCSLCYYMCYKWKVKVQWKCSESVSLSHVQLFTTPWAGAHQAPLFVEFSR